MVSVWSNIERDDTVEFLNIWFLNGGDIYVN